MKTIIALSILTLFGAATSLAPRSASPEDPALLRRRLLAALDRRIDDACARQHLEARLALDQEIPLPYLGVDTEPVPDGLRLIAVYAETAADRAGLKKGDILRSLDGDPVDSKVTLGKAIRKNPVGTKVVVKYERNGAAETAEATLLARPEEDEDEDEQFPDLPPLFVPSAEPFRFDFETAVPGPLPDAFESILGGHGVLPDWRVIAEGGVNFLRQTSGQKTGIHFPMAIVRDFRAADASGTIRFRYQGGVIDRAAGVVLRYQGPGDYLVARVNAAEADLRIFRVAGGRRQTLPGAIAAAPNDDREWHTLSFRAEGVHLTAVYDGRSTAVGVDSYFLRGRAGIWTKSDSVTDIASMEFKPIAPAKK